MDIPIDTLPIPDWGLECPRCRYPLKGLPSHRCPECGLEFDIAKLIQPWTRLRPPRFTGDELPLPDFGLRCDACGAPLAGAAQRACPTCGRSFDPQNTRPAEDWFVLDSESCGGLPIPNVQVLFATEHVPYTPVHERTFREIYGGTGVHFDRLRVPTEFFFEVLWLLRQTREQIRAARAEPGRRGWRCEHCGKRNPGHFEICWNCQTARQQRGRHTETPQ